MSKTNFENCTNFSETKFKKALIIKKIRIKDMTDDSFVSKFVYDNHRLEISPTN